MKNLQVRNRRPKLYVCYTNLCYIGTALKLYVLLVVATCYTNDKNEDFLSCKKKL